MAKDTAKQSKSELADSEYKRLVDLYTGAGADATRLQVNDALIRKVAELWADLERIKALPLLIYDRRNPTVQKETAAGKARTRYMAQYASCMQKLNKEMLGTLNNDDDDGLSEYDDDGK